MAGTSYTRQSTLSDGNIITAALFNNEFNQILNAFAYASTGTTGHSHDGSAGQGAAISKIGDQDFKNKIEVSAANNRIEFYAEVGGFPVEQVRIQDGAIVPVTDSDVDLGTTSVRFKDAYVDSATVTNTLSAGGVITASSGVSFPVAEEAIFGSTFKIKGGTPHAFLDLTGSLGTMYFRGDRLYFGGGATGNATGLSASLEIFGDNGSILSSNGNTKMTIDSNDIQIPDDVKLKFGNGNDLQIYHDGDNSRITDSGTGNLYLTGASNISLLSNATTYGVFGTSVDLYYSNIKKFETTSAGATITGNATVTGAVGAQTFNASSSIDTPALEVTTLKARDGSAAGSIANSTGVTTLNSAVLTTADINGGTADGVVIGGSTAAAGTFTTINGTTSTVTTSNATTVDTTNLEVTNLKAKDGTSAGSIADSTGVVTLASSVLTTADINGGTIDGTVIGGGTIDGTVIGGSTAAAGTFTTGTIATADINGGAIDGTVIGGTTPAAGNFTTLGATGTFSASTTTISATPGTDVSPLTVNRVNNDGAVLSLQQAGVDQLKVYSTGGNRPIIVGEGDKGLKITPTSIHPRFATNSAFDATLDLGLSASRFKDFYLSGGAYLGGTGDSNKLDDYEKGTFTPTLYDKNATDGNQAVVGTPVGSYTKVGDLVTCVINLSDIDVSTNSMVSGQQLHIHGLPFTSRSGRLVPVPLYCVQVSTGTPVVAPFGIFSGGGTFLQLRVVFEGGGTAALNVSAINNTSSDIHLAFSYHTDS